MYLNLNAINTLRELAAGRLNTQMTPHHPCLPGTKTNRLSLCSMLRRTEMQQK
jgi:hypothetical protein